MQQNNYYIVTGTHNNHIGERNCLVHHEQKLRTKFQLSDIKQIVIFLVQQSSRTCFVIWICQEDIWQLFRSEGIQYCDCYDAIFFFVGSNISVGWKYCLLLLIVFICSNVLLCANFVSVNKDQVFNCLEQNIEMLDVNVVQEKQYWSLTCCLSNAIVCKSCVAALRMISLSPHLIGFSTCMK